MLRKADDEMVSEESRVKIAPPSIVAVFETNDDVVSETEELNAYRTPPINAVLLENMLDEIETRELSDVMTPLQLLTTILIKATIEFALTIIAADNDPPLLLLLLIVVIVLPPF